MKKEDKKMSLGGVREDSISDVRPNDLQKGLGGKMEWKMKKEGTVKSKTDRASSDSVY